MKLKTFCAIIGCLALQFSAQGTEVPDSVQPENIIRGQVEGIAEYFEVKNSDYLNISLSTSIPLKLNILSIPQTIYITIDSACTDSLAAFTVKGLSANSTYYLYNEKGKLFQLSSDQNGVITFKQDITYKHTVWIQPRPSTLYLKNNPSYGIGWFDQDDQPVYDNSVSWNPMDRIAYVNTNISQSIYIQLDNVILEGNYHDLNGTSTGNGINITGKNVTVRRVDISGFSVGINATGDSAIIEYCSFSNCMYGIRSTASSSNYGKKRIYRNNYFVLTGYETGIYNNSVSAEIDVNVFSASSSYYTYGIINFSEGRVVDIETNRFLNVNNGINLTASQSPDPVYIRNNTFQNARTAINASGVDASIIANNTFDRCYTSIYMSNVNNSVIKENKIADGTYGLENVNGASNIILRNEFNQRTVVGLQMIEPARGNYIYNNIFDLYGNNNYPSSGSSNNWNYGNWKGNWWSNYQYETPYSLYSGNTDFEPLVFSWSNVNQLPAPDLLPPVTTILVPQPNGNNGWYKYPVTINFTSSDQGGSGVKYTMYTKPSSTSAPFCDYGQSLTINSGKNTIGYYSVDAFGNMETPRIAEVNIDTTKPEIRNFFTGIQNGRTGWYLTGGTIFVYCIDENEGSGLKYWGYRLNTGNFTVVNNNRLELFYNTEGITNIYILAEDSAGNQNIVENQLKIDRFAPVPDVASLPDLKGLDVIVTSYPTATDNVAGNIVGTTNSSLEYHNPGTYQIIWKYSDGNGHDTTQAQKVIVLTDNTPPVPKTNPLPDIKGQCSATVTPPLAIDDFAGEVTGTTTDPLNYNAQGSYTITWTYKDSKNNVTTQQQKIVIKDTIAPQFTLVPANKTVEATGPKTIVSIGNATAEDNCGNVTVTSNAPASFGLGATTITFTATDEAGNKKQASMTVTVTDKTIPAVPQISTVERECFYTIESAPVASDLVDGTITGVTSSGTLPLTISGLGDHTIIWTFTDKSGNKGTAQQIVKIVDKTAPYFTSVPVNKIVEATGPRTVVSIADAVALDNCGSVTVTSNAPQSYPLGVTTVTFTAKDGAGNTKQASMTVTVTDKTAPSVPQIASVEGECSYTIESAPVANDLVDGTITGVTSSGTLPLTISGLGDHTIIWTFTDKSGNKETAQQIVRIVDKTAPYFTSVPVNKTVEATGPRTVVSIADAVALDNCGSVTVTSNAPQSYPLGVTTVTFTAKDGAGNSKQASMTVTVTDNTAPSAPQIASVEGECSYTIESAPIANDLVDGNITGATDRSLPIIITGLGEHVVEWIFTDKNGNHSTSKQMITIIDKTAPEFTSVPSNITVEATGPKTQVNLGIASAQDNCGSITIKSDAPEAYGLGITTVTFTATDLAGNSKQVSMTVTVTDNTAPSAPQIASVEGECFYTIESAPVANDLVDGNITGATDRSLPIIITGLGEHIVEWIFTDKNGNHSTSKQIVTIIDKTAPEFTSVPSNITVEATGPKTQVNLGIASAQDNCGSITIKSDAPEAYGLGITTVTFTATDLAGNSKQVSMTVTVTDNTAPSAPQIASVEGECSYTIESAPVANDLVDGNITGATDRSLPIIITGLGEHIVEWIFTDKNGNHSTSKQIVTIIDKTAPEFTSVPENVILEATGFSTPVILEQAIAHDNCGTVKIVSDAPDAYLVGKTTVTFTATDLAGNITKAVITVTITDKTIPAAPQINPVEGECFFIIEDTPVAYDLVDGNVAGTTMTGELPIILSGLGEHKVVWKFTDKNGNSSISEQIVTIFDKTVPEFTFVPDSMTVEATGQNTPVSMDQAIAQDNCGTVKVTSDAPEQYVLGQTAVIFTATDLAGNNAYDTVYITITDKTAPSVPQIEPVVGECSYTVATAPVASDLVDGSITGKTSEGSLPLTLSGLGNHTILWTFTDKNGNVSTAQQVISIIDTTSPEFTVVPASVTIEATGPGTPVSIGNAAAQDNCGNVTINSDAPDMYPVGINTVTFTAIDLAGNKRNAHVNVTVTDLTPPVAPKIESVEGGCYYTIDKAPAGSDLVDGVVYGVADAGTLPLTITGYGTHVIKWTFTDKNGNSSTAEQKVRIKMSARAYMFDEALNETNISKPRIYLKNDGDVAISNFIVEYYFRMENGKRPIVENYYTPGSTIGIVNLGYNYYKIVFNYKNTTIIPGQILPNTSGIVVGIHDSSYTTMDKKNDYSNNLSSVFAENNHICVFTADGRLISGTPLFVNAEPVAYAGENVTITDRDGDGEIVILNGSSSYDPDGSVMQYSWFVDGEFHNEDSVTSVKLMEGVHTIQLKVTDNHGSVGYDTVAVVINGNQSALKFSVNTDSIPVNTPVSVIYEIPSSMNGAKVRALLERTWDVLPWALPGTAGVHKLQINDWNKYFFGGQGPWTIRFEVNGVVVDSKQIVFKY